MRMSAQFMISLLIVALGTAALAGEYLLVHWYPQHRQNIAERAFQLLPYRNPSLGIQMQVAAGIYGKVTDFPGGVRIERRSWLGESPSLAITAQPNPDGATEFSAQLLAQWQTQGTQENILGYRFEHTQIHGRDAAIIWQPRAHSTLVTAHIISPDRIAEIDCLSGSSDPALLTQACESSIATVELAGPPSPRPQPPPPGVLHLENIPPTRSPTEGSSGSRKRLRQRLRQRPRGRKHGSEI